MAKISAFNHGQMVKISTMTTAKIQIFDGQNGQPKILPRNIKNKHQFWPWPWTKYKFLMVKMVNRWSNHEVWPQNKNFDHWPWGRFQDVSGHGQIFDHWPWVMVSALPPLN